MAEPVRAEVLLGGPAVTGPACVLTAPISFWGGVDPDSGAIIDVRHPECGTGLSGKVVFLPGTIGSSSASAVLLELIRNRRAPAALVLHEPDAILLLGVIVGREMGWETLPAFKLDRAYHSGFGNRIISVSGEGTIAGKPQ